MYHRSAKPPFFCNAFCGLADSCTLPAWSACNRCSSDGSSTPIHGRLCAATFLPPASLRPGCTPGSRRRLLALHLDPSALAGALLVQHETGFDVSALLLLCLGRNRDAASRTACHSIIPKQFFSSTLILANGPPNEPVIHSS